MTPTPSNTPQPLEPLWYDDEIKAYACDRTGNPSVQAAICGAMLELRWSYEKDRRATDARLAALQARVDELEQVESNLYESIVNLSIVCSESIEECERLRGELASKGDADGD